MDKKTAEISRVRIERFRERLAALVLPETVALRARCAHCPSSVAAGERERLDYRSISEGEAWAHAWESAWFHLEGEVPREWRGRPVVAQIDIGGEGLVFDAAGRILQGISSGSIWLGEFNREIVPLFGGCAGGERVELWLEGAASSLFGVVTEQDPAPDSPQRYGRFEPVVNKLRLACLDPDVRALWLDLRILIGLVQRLPEQSVRRARLLRAGMETIDRFGGSAENARAARAVLAAELEKPAAPTELTAIAIGHAHIDTAWLWPVAETVRKCARTFASQLALIETYPEYLFGASQAQHYAFVKQHYPELYERVRDAVARGRWEVQGGMWVEADCNVPGGESLIRQILHGKNFFRDEFGIEVDNLWLPDVFGYSPALPQILRKSGIRFFLTQKLSWNQTNDFPHTTLRWRGIDGSEVIAHFPPENNYNSLLDASTLIAGSENFREKELLDEFLCLFGVGDGGGGPKDEQIEWGLRMRDLEGTPRVRFGMARDFFARLEPHAASLPVWSGELYLELHRGTLTTQARTKADNRRLESDLRAVEYLWSCLPAADYPAQRLDGIWKAALRNQFHDILPGSSITKVYTDTRREHAECLDACKELTRDAGARLFTPDPEAIVLVNCTSALYNGAVELPDGFGGRELVDPATGPLPAQREGDRTVAQVRIPPQGIVTLKQGRASIPEAIRPTGDGLVLANDRVRYVFDRDATILEAVDIATGRAILATGERGNALTLYEDRPNNWDAWDIDAFYAGARIETARSVECEPLGRGAVRQGIRFQLGIGASAITQTIFLAEGTLRLDFHTEITWREDHKMLRVAFPVNVRADHASFDIAYGIVRRPTHRNTSWDAARFEVAAHRYVDLSEPTHGVALLNDAKYGHKVLDNVIDLNLLRSPTYPDPDADRGEHAFTYSLYPHAGDLAASDVIEQATSLNRGLLVFAGRAATGAGGPPIRVSGEGVSLEALKKAERGRSWIARLVETRGRRTRARLHPERPGCRAARTDLMEWNDEETVPLTQGLEIDLGPFEIVTVRITPPE